MRRLLGYALVGYGTLLVSLRFQEKRVVWAAERLLFEAACGDAGYWADIWDDED